VSGLKDDELINKANLHETEAYKLYSRLFGKFLPNVIKIETYNFELYRFKFGAFFDTQCIIIILALSPAFQIKDKV